MELWRQVKGYEGYYEVSNLGNVRSLARNIKHSRAGYERILHGRLLSPQSNKKRSNYMYVHMSKGDDHKSNSLVHRLVAEAWIPNPLNLPQVNHKDFDTTNNKVENLEWCDANYNVNYSKSRRPNMRGKWGRRIQAFDMQGNFVGEYGSVRDAARALNCFGQNISTVLNGKGKWVKGHTFKDVNQTL